MVDFGHHNWVGWDCWGGEIDVKSPAMLNILREVDHLLPFSIKDHLAQMSIWQRLKNTILSHSKDWLLLNDSK